MEDKPKEIVIKIKTNDIKKIAYISVLIILAVLLILQYFFPLSCPNSDYENKIEKKQETALTEMQVIPEPIKIEPEVPEEPKTAESKTNETQTEGEKEETQEDEEGPSLAITGDLYFKINDVIYEVKGEDWAKVTKIKYTISNAQSIDFTPKIYAYLYDDNDPDDIKNYIEETIILPELKSGYEITETSDVSISFNEINKTKTIKLILKDQDENTLDTIYYKLTVSS